LDDPDKDLIKVLPSLGLANPQLVGDNWRSMSEGHHWYRFSWDRVIGGCLTGGIPWIMFFTAILMRRRSELTLGTWWAGLFLFLYLMPYVLISHYLRYQVPLLGMQAILLTAGTIAISRTLKQAISCRDSCSPCSETDKEIGIFAEAADVPFFSGQRRSGRRVSGDIKKDTG
jgi:hypothetical protein